MPDTPWYHVTKSANLGGWVIRGARWIELNPGLIETKGDKWDAYNRAKEMVQNSPHRMGVILEHTGSSGIRSYQGWAEIDEINGIYSLRPSLRTYDSNWTVKSYGLERGTAERGGLQKALPKGVNDLRGHYMRKDEGMKAIRNAARKSNAHGAVVYKLDRSENAQPYEFHKWWQNPNFPRSV